ncbi:MAG TPA: phenylacetate--CoA ligase [Thermoleophilia bacterium]|nr:phenylacetate--CoA ligase [Thermoleophilia bacterium]
MARPAREALQLERLQRAAAYVYERVPFYRRKLDEAGLTPTSVRTLDDLRRLPFTTKDDFHDNYPYGLFAVPLSEVVRVHSSSGTIGKPVVAGYTAADLDMWSELIARLVTAAGVTTDDVAQIAFGYGMFTGGFGLHYGLERVGATVVPHSAGNTNRQLQFMLDFGSTVLVATPSYALYLGEMLDRRGVDRSRLKLRLGLFGAEPCSESMRRQIEARMPISATDNYGLTEVMGPGVAGECELKDGMHVSEDHFIVEVVDPESGEPVAEGELGELIFTSLTKQASPVLRYRTRDLSTLTREPCACGRTTARLGKFHGRTDDMFVISGINIFPSTIENILFEIEGVEPHYQIVLRRKNGWDSFEVRVEVTEELFDGWQDDMVAFERRVADELRSELLVRPKVKLVEPGSLERSTGKARRILDLREGGEGAPEAAQPPAGAP